MKFKEKKMNRETFVSIWPDVKTIFIKQNLVILCIYSPPKMQLQYVLSTSFFLKGSFRINQKA